MTDYEQLIEALRKRLVSALTALHLANEKMGYYGIQPYTEADGDDMISDWVKTLVHEELEQQMPKRGEWVKGADGLYHCSVCGATAPYLDAFDGVIQYWENLFYCNNCVAKMEAQE